MACSENKWANTPNLCQGFSGEKDYDGLSKVAHKAKSSVAVMGMTHVADLLKELEILAHNEKEKDRYQSMIDEFLEMGNLAVIELEQSKS